MLLKPPELSMRRQKKLLSSTPKIKRLRLIMKLPPTLKKARMSKKN